LIDNRHLPSLRSWLATLSTAESDVRALLAVACCQPGAYREPGSDGGGPGPLAQPPSAKADLLRRLLDVRQRLEHLRNRCNDLAIFQQRYRPAAAEPVAVPAASHGPGGNDDDDFVEVVPDPVGLPAADSAPDNHAADDAEEQARADARRRGKQKVVEDVPEPAEPLADTRAETPAPPAPPAAANAVVQDPADDDVLARMLLFGRLRR